MNSTVSVSQGRARFPAIVKAVNQGDLITVTERGKPVAVLVGHEWLTSMIETMEIMANPDAMKAIHDYKAGKMKFYRLEDIPA